MKPIDPYALRPIALAVARIIRPLRLPETTVSWPWWWRARRWLSEKWDRWSPV